MRTILRIVCYGAGEGFRWFQANIKSEIAEIVAVIDEKIEKIGLIPVVSAERLFEIEFDYVVICSRTYQGEMIGILKKMGCSLKKIAVAFNCIQVGSHVNTDLMKKITGAECFLGGHVCASGIDGSIFIHLESKLDKENVEKVYQEIKDILLLYGGKGYIQTIIDASQLKKITSSGLRLLFKLSKICKYVTIRDVSESLYRLFLSCNLEAHMNVESRFQMKPFCEISIDGCPIIAKSYRCKVYLWNGDTAIKVYNDISSEVDNVRSEGSRFRHLTGLGISTPAYCGIVRFGDRVGVAYEYTGSTIHSQIMQHPNRLGEYISNIAQLMKKIHHTKTSSSLFPNINDILSYCCKKVDNALLTDDEKQLLNIAISSLPKREYLLHGDFTLNNITEKDGDLYLLDVASVAIGHPIYDIARFYWTHVEHYKNAKDVEPFVGSKACIMLHMWDAFRLTYFGEIDESEREEIDEMVQFYSMLMQLTVNFCDPYMKGKYLESIKEARKVFFPYVENNCQRFSNIIKAM